EKEKAKEEAKAKRKAEREAAKIAAKEAAEQQKEQRKKEAEERRKAIAERKAAKKANGQRRAKATHFIYTGNGLSQPQEHSTRGRVLAAIKEGEVGVAQSIDELGEKVKDQLFGASVRSYLSKLEEMGHIEFVDVESNDDAEDGDQAE
ncbi:hypothetical protein BOU83_005149, partial [Escherichia coli]|nr:hypothetical protein [Escherichia coli]